MAFRLSLLLAALFTVTAARAQVVVSEFMYFPDSSQNEWVELYNPGTGPVNLDGWTIRDNTDGAGKPLTGTIAAGEYMIVARRPAMFAEQYGTVSCNVIDVPFQQYNDAGDAIIVQNGAGDTVDLIDYTTAWGKERNHTLEKIDPALPSNQQSSWLLSTALGGTPCARNSVASVGGGQRVAPPQVRLTSRRSIAVEFNAPSRTPRRALLTSSDGREVLAVSLNGERGEIACDELPAGVYLLLVTDRENGSTAAVPIVLQ